MTGVQTCALPILINNLEIDNLFKDENEKEGIGVTDFINWIVQILKRELVQLRISAQEAGLMEPVELWDKG